MTEWRRFFERRSPREASEGFELLDLNDGALWDLTLRLMAYNPSDRISASDALQHPAFGRSAISRAVQGVLNSTGKALKVGVGQHHTERGLAGCCKMLLSLCSCLWAGWVWRCGCCCTCLPALPVPAVTDKLAARP